MQAEESIGMAMTFTIASAAREALSALIADRLKREKEEDDRKAREYEEVRCFLILLENHASDFAPYLVYVGHDTDVSLQKP